jgi:hypothetical protein
MAKSTIAPEPRSAQEKSSHNARKLKVQYSLCERYKPKTPRPSSNNPDVKVPQVLLKGRWLENAGFAVGSFVNVDVDGGRLVITPVGGDQ